MIQVRHSDLVVSSFVSWKSLKRNVHYSALVYEISLKQTYFCQMQCDVIQVRQTYYCHPHLTEMG